MIRVGVLTLSDKGASGDRKDESGPTIKRIVKSIGAKVEYYKVIPDDKEGIIKELKKQVDDLGLDLILTTGGTGLSPRDFTPDATLEVIEREVPGLAEAMRAKSLKKTSRAMLTRGLAGTRANSLIVNLPGSPKAVRECLEVILDVLPHAIEILQGRGGECGRAEGKG
ncbi:MogA/MoaB family molybdenum cofactor biosynthesis protein [Halonatronum saccharophilum]|uniref:MogA/MoaB family molybdenum cofactor biosynthesis protein n=1 Tax=Halonatronum saccharophilum TaxID=150060 RepID=UPI0004885468|nr:MogA/MoaB family molybdenum cofactor biosynthesis protein [Halonatronum saccharophilum]